MILTELWQGVWFILPAWAGNMLACTFGGGRPIDGGKTFTDGRPILGKGKTIRGVCVGVFSAIGVALAQRYVLSFFDLYDYWFNPYIFGMLMGGGAMIGDLVKSFVKRRLDFPSGSPFPPFDQLDFIAGALVMYYGVGPYVLNRFYHLTWKPLLAIVVISPLIHLLFNIIGYKLNMKDVWW
jgi:CDP-2,3-bis-(O-geranylgeranyl)-sn-glycerol synthase